ncbi:oxidoreductase [Pseudonocardia sp. KRD-184]|uniref:Oxidoreductase n=1 Tax=Pseudonocardia oceani TaxID=2792013 RepID=A0ABS6UGE0_9PSEU|nr:PDR/VanB family oxidoreductase [Pseudonocardia oceani]MBW0088357.1 oxidoreductase [Pseudonocardia oceani]MBW0096582.1 oxidoreductase [Pseudonocardia oceani]MBW0109248.1 oxidoreductase [Pseudonocardia oceani]MBW0120317.1 oxidoreductase [Pseudonocardia oceani]MBW0130934.1 oxidoreductase [Pseudonocardia oceani]
MTGPAAPNAARAAAEQELPVVVVARESVAEDVVALTLRRPDGADLPAWTPGAHVDLVLDEHLERQYSLCGDPEQRDTWRVAVLREPDGRGGSARVHDGLAVGDTLVVRGPRNHFGLGPAPRYVFVAGGIGITPILPMIAAAQALGAEWTLLYGGRRSASMAFREQLAEHGDRVRLWPQDSLGLLPLDDVLGTPQDGTLIYCCGPEPLLRAVEERCAGWPHGALHVERFAPKEVGEPVRAAGFRVVCSRAGIEVVVPPERSILEVLEDAGAPVPSSCREGTCGTCEADVLAGRPDHRDSLLTDDEQDSGEIMLICVSRSLDDELVLDI